MIDTFARIRIRNVAQIESSTRPIRVAFVIDELSTAGTETQLLALIRSIDRTRISPYLVLLEGRSTASKRLEPTDCPVIRLGIHRLVGRSSLSAAWRMIRWLRREQIDIVQAYFHDSVYFASIIARLARVKRVIRVQNNTGYAQTGMRMRFTRMIGHLLSHTLTNSEAARDDLIARRITTPDRVTVLENGVDLDRFANISPIDGRTPLRKIGLVGNLRSVKNVDGLIRAAAIVLKRFPDAQFSIAGEGPDREMLELLIAEQGIGASVQLVGSIADVPQFLSQQQVAVLCSHSEGMSNALLEYLAAGRAVVATSVGANPRLIDHERHGLLVPAGDDSELASAIMRLMEDSILAAELASNARDRVESQFSRVSMCRRFEAFYAQLMSDF